jgi:hypothetical protein
MIGVASRQRISSASSGGSYMAWHLESQPGVGDTAWDEAVNACHGSVFHSSAWSRYLLLARPNTSPIQFRLVDDQGQIAGVALGFRTQSPRRLAASLTRQLWFDALPVMAGTPNGVEPFVEALESYARGNGDVVIAFNSFGYRGGSEVLRTRGYRLTERLEFELDVSPDLEVLWAALDHKRRKNANKSRRAGVVVEELGPDAGLDQLYRLHAVTWDRLEKRGVKRIGQGNLGGARAPERELLDCRVGRLVGARLDTEWLTVSLFTRFDDQVYHVLSGHSSRALEVQAPTLLLWEAIARYRSEGVRLFNFGGCAAAAREPGSLEHGVFDYKRAFGGSCLECASGCKELRPGRAALGRLARTIAGR